MHQIDVSDSHVTRPFPVSALARNVNLHTINMLLCPVLSFCHATAIGSDLFVLEHTIAASGPRVHVASSPGPQELGNRERAWET